MACPKCDDVRVINIANEVVELPAWNFIGIDTISIGINFCPNCGMELPTNGEDEELLERIDYARG